MPLKGYDIHAGKRATNVTVNADLLREAKALNINLSQVLEHSLAELVQEARRQQWLTENQQALDDYNRHIERDGVWSDELRRF
jgi:antitoxin CcdA